MIVDNLTAQQMKDNVSELARKLKEEGFSRESWEKLKTTDMFKAPASTMHHSVFTGGLLDHSLGVAEWFEILRSIPGLPRNPNIRTYTVAIAHDFCKLGVYVQEIKPRKVNGKWREELVWVFKENYPMGHGEKSVDLCVEFGLNLSREERLCVRHHMGPYELTGIPLKTYQEAIKVVPEVLLLHTADMLEATYGRPLRLEGSKNVETVSQNEEGPEVYRDGPGN